MNVLLLTDHSNHNSENSVYAFARALRRHSATNRVDIASRGIPENKGFFQSLNTTQVTVSEITDDFRFTKEGTAYTKHLQSVSLLDYDFIWLRLPPPLDPSFLGFLESRFSKQIIMNDPAGIYDTGSKEFLMNFRTVCPPMRICRSVDDIISFRNKFPIVLKPFREYGGRGIVRIDGDQVWKGHSMITFQKFAEEYRKDSIKYLGVKFLKNVSKGDKRIIVVDGNVLGASLRLPGKDSWICNVAMGGTSHLTEIDDEEYKIVDTIHPLLSKMGIVMYGIDTLVDDDGKRVLSEINTTSIGGLPQIARLKNMPLVENAVNLILSYVKRKKIDAEIH